MEKKFEMTFLCLTLFYISKPDILTEVCRLSMSTVDWLPILKHCLDQKFSNISHDERFICLINLSQTLKVDPKRLKE